MSDDAKRIKKDLDSGNLPNIKTGDGKKTKGIAPVVYHVGCDRSDSKHLIESARHYSRSGKTTPVNRPDNASAVKANQSSVKTQQKVLKQKKSR